jgi:hypothetical protein
VTITAITESKPVAQSAYFSDTLDLSMLPSVSTGIAANYLKTVPQTQYSDVTLGAVSSEEVNTNYGISSDQTVTQQASKSDRMNKWLTYGSIGLAASTSLVAGFQSIKRKRAS